jgi:adenine-specific DNA-methyltransferase
MKEHRDNKQRENYKDNLDYRTNIPHIIKYMGSKRELIEYLTSAINEIYEGERICDLFAGTSILSGALGHESVMHSNDIQEYSAVLAKTYLGNYEWNKYDGLVDKLVQKAQGHVELVNSIYPELEFSYNTKLSLNEFNATEQQQQELIYFDFEDIEHDLFIKNYSGTYWSFKQCLWIDAIRIAAEEYSKTPVYYPILSSLMFAMAYNAQSTGHYAQYRDAYNVASMNDIIIYRNKEILPYFKKKLIELMEWTGRNALNHTVTTLDYMDCLEIIPTGSLVYADPPYAFVHYSRFYHALETLVKYDYPKVSHKGRYRSDRHQSPFCKRTMVSNAFSEMFKKIQKKRAKLILSYSNTGMITLEQILKLANIVFEDRYSISTKAIDYTHSTMGRFEDKSREVKEFLVIAQPI